MNRSVFLFPLSATLVFLIGFVIVGAVKKPVKAPALSIRVDGAEVSTSASDTISLFETQTLTIVLRDEKQAKGTKWFLNKGFFARDTASFVTVFDGPGNFEVSIESNDYLNSAILVKSLEALRANISYPSNPESGYMPDELITFSDSTESVKDRKWFVNDKMVGEKSDQLEHSFDTPGRHEVRVRSILADGSIAMREITVEIEQEPVAAPVRSSGGGSTPAKKVIKGFYNKKRVGFDQRISREVTATLGADQASQMITVHQDFELAKVVLIGKAKTGSIQLRLIEQVTGNEVYNSIVKCSDGVPIQFTLPRPVLRAGKTYQFLVYLGDGADIAVFDISKKSGSNYKSPDDYFTIQPGSNKHWLFDWTIYAH